MSRRALVASCLLAVAAAAQPADDAPLDIVALQPWRQATSVAIDHAALGSTRATLINLNPNINVWFLLRLDGGPEGRSASYHLESARPSQQVTLDASKGGSLRITDASGTTHCAPWTGSPRSALDEARRSALPEAPLCGARLYLRNPIPGHRTALEATTQFLRDHVWGGEQIIGFVRREFYRDAFALHPAPASGASAMPTAATQAPAPAVVAPGWRDKSVQPEDLDIDLRGEPGQALTLGQWFAVRGVDGVQLSAMLPAALVGSPALRGGHAWHPDAVESQSLAVLVAFDLSRFDMGFSLGTDHPRLGWSTRVPEERRDARPGPDGIDDARPLVRTGLLAPFLQARAVATFTGGFKREHGAFRSGALATQHLGSHYGFIEQGVVFSTLQPGLATLLVHDDGRVDMKTWIVGDDIHAAHIRHARQNGVPLLEPDALHGGSVPGALVDQWGAGNWSGSADEKLRTLRAGACLIETASTRYLVYGYFSSATPPTMARVFQAYGCRYAMHLDMNALEHTYLALYVRRDGQVAVEHLVEGMTQLDKSLRGSLLPRFLAFPDDRDFFYLLRKEAP